MSAFTPDAARRLDGPHWLEVRRTAAAEAFAGAGLPSPDEEIWRYSRVADLDLDLYPLAPGRPAPVGGGVDRLLSIFPDRAATVITVDGAIARVDVAEPFAAAGLVAGPLREHRNGEELLGLVVTKPTDVFSVMNDAFSADPILVQVPAGVTVDAPIVVVHWFTGNGSAVFPRLVVDAGADSESRVLDVYASDHEAGAGNLVVPVTELSVGPAARLGYVNLQELALSSWQIASTVARVDRDGDLESTCAGLGAEYARQRTDCHLDGRGATGNLRAVYFGEGRQTLDFRTFQDHAAPDTTSDLLFKGALGGSSRSVYSGLIRVEKNARGTNAYQTNRNIKLSDDAWAESVPNLEILNNDVRCSHASAVGPVDEEQRFYLESRGVPRAEAERLIVTGFFEDILSELPVPAAIGPLRRTVAAKFARRSES
ncbi:MAG: SufB/SufD family protein [Acidimicrobiales bacterium]